MKAFLKFGLLSLMTIFLLSGCKKEPLPEDPKPSNKLIGKWDCTYVDEHYLDFWEDEYIDIVGTPAELGLTLSLEFLESGKFNKVITQDGIPYLQQGNYIYSEKDNLLSDGSNTYTITFSGNTMSMESVVGESHRKYKYKKAS